MAQKNYSREIWGAKVSNDGLTCTFENPETRSRSTLCSMCGTRRIRCSEGAKPELPFGSGLRAPCGALKDSSNSILCTVNKRWCGRPDLNRHRPFGPTDFRTNCGFRRRRHYGVCGLDYPFAVLRTIVEV